jgi:hypothetical protein
MKGRMAGRSVWERKKVIVRGSQTERWDGWRVSVGKEKGGSLEIRD